MSAESNKGSIRYLFVYYSIPIRPNVKNDRHKGTKKVCETADIVRGLPTENTKSTKMKMYMKSENIEPQNTQNTQKYIMVQERDKKKFLRLFALSAVKKRNNRRHKRTQKINQ